jgi:hypothetical protein
MQMLKLTAIAAALVAASMSASAMTTIADDDLSAVAGQDGVSIAANLNINIGSFVYSESNPTTTGSASVGFNNIQITGLLAMTVDVVSQSAFSQLYAGMTGQTIAATSTLNPLTGVVTQSQGTATGPAATGFTGTSAHSIAEGAILTAQGLATTDQTTGAVTVKDQTASFYSGGDVVQFAFPNVTAKAGTLVDIKVGGITMGVNGQQASSGAPSFGSFSLNQLDLRGTTVWMWAH